MGLGSKVDMDQVRSGDIRKERMDVIPREIVLHLSINNREISFISCSPDNITELAAGFAVSGGYVKDYRDIHIIEICDREKLDPTSGNAEKDTGTVTVHIKADDVFSGDLRPGYIQPGCGNIDGKETAGIPGIIKPGMRVASGVIAGLNAKNLSAQEHKKEFGGLHSASLFDREGRLLAVREDIGRHNCLDRVIGYMLINGIGFYDKLLFTSGRISLDLVFKAVRMSVPVVISNSSVTWSAVMLARRCGLALIGYARGKRFNIYSNPESII